MSKTVRMPSGLMSLDTALPESPGIVLDEFGRPVHTKDSTVKLKDVYGDLPSEDATTAHYRVRAFYRRLFKGRDPKETSVLDDIAASSDREWLENLLLGLDTDEPGPSRRARRRWRQAIEHRLSALPPAELPGPPIPREERAVTAAAMAE